MRLPKRWMALIAFVLPLPAFAQDTGPVEVYVEGGQQAAQPVAVPQLAARGPANGALGNIDTVSNNVSLVISDQLRRTGVITPIGPVGIRRLRNEEVTSPAWTDWRRSGASALVTGYTEYTSDGRLTVACYLYDTASGRELVRRGFAVSTSDWRRAATKCADAIYSRLSGEEAFLDTRVVYVAETGSKANRVKRIAIMDSDGENHRYLTEGLETVLTPRFSPTGRQLVYMSYKGRRPRSYVLDLNTGQSRLLVPGTAFTFAPNFSPDGSRIVFSMAEGGNTDIYVVGANGGTPQRLTTMPGVDTSPSFSPDGRQIVFESDRSGSQQLYTMNADGSNQQRISFGGGQYASPAWSPQGNRIAFTKIGGGQFRIGVMAPTGGGERLLTSAWQDEGASWAPNGQFVMFHRTDRGSGDATLYAVPVNGGRARIMPTPLGGSDPSWSPLQD
ncbi:Tol-Pal system beta propeller repeat protein TolB [Sphingomicrobium sp. XHP0239]|uniref:Tol-Pal system beta propeller repeat protein TolB n=1 Tax=Sphingomicrobium maritimum TaxID=3133972 RepID=UPI0031CC4A13